MMSMFKTFRGMVRAYVYRWRALRNLRAAKRYVRDRALLEQRRARLLSRIEAQNAEYEARCLSDR
jgi:hypothetical protein